MKKYLLLAFLFSGLITNAQTNTSTGNCKAQFKYSVNNMLMSPVPSTAINFYDRSEGKVTAWFWDFGDGTKSQEQNPFHIYIHPAPSPYVKLSPYRTVSLTILTSDTCKSFYSEVIDIMSGTTTSSPGCKAFFKYYQTDYDSVRGKATFQMDNYSEGDSLTYLWKFDDGQTSTERQPLVTFDNKPAKHLACLTITGKNNCADSFCDSVKFFKPVVIISPPPACMARYKYHEVKLDSLAQKVTYEFNNYSEGDSLTYLWFFDNGITSTEKEPVITFDIKQLPIKASLTVLGKNGCSDIFWDAVYFFHPIIYPPIPVDSIKCETAFGYSVNYNIKPFAPALVLDFYSKAFPEVLEWNWDFGDGTSSNEQNPTHMFNFPLNIDPVLGDPNPFRKVCLTVKTVTGCMASSCQTINIYMSTVPPVDPVPQCHAWIKYYRPTDIISIPEVIPYKLIDASEGKVIRRLWQFEDGTTSKEAEPQVNFNFMKPDQKVCLTIWTADSCSSTWCETILVNGNIPDSINTGKTSLYTMRYQSSFPQQMPSCAGWAKAQVYLKDSLINASNYSWSTGDLTQEVKGLCPTQFYTVKATTPNGTIVSGTFIFNSDGTTTDVSLNFWVTGLKENPMILCKPVNRAYTVEWHLCDGSIITGDSIPVNSMNCASDNANMVLKDAAGNVVYTENISQKTFATLIKPDQQESSSVKLYPNPVKDVLNITYSGKLVSEMQIEICDISGKSVSSQKIQDVESGQNISLNVNSLQKGIYLCKMTSGKNVIGTEKFIK